MPPKLRKRWIHQSSEALKEANASTDASQLGGLASPRGTMGEGSLNGQGRSSADGSQGEEANHRTEMDVDVNTDGIGGSKQQTEMLPPPMPASLDPTTISSVSASAGPSSLPAPQDYNLSSPSASFAKLSLLSLSPLLSTALGIRRSKSPLGDGELVMDISDAQRKVTRTSTVADFRAESPTPLSRRIPDDETSKGVLAPMLDVIPRSHSSERTESSRTEHITPPSSPMTTHAPDPTHRRPTPPIPRSPTPPPVPPVPPPPKVKMSLKDFAIRKKKQREEMSARSQSNPQSLPVGPASSLAGVDSSIDESNPKVNGHGGGHGNEQVVPNDSMQNISTLSYPTPPFFPSPASTLVQHLSQHNGAHEIAWVKGLDSLQAKVEQLGDARIPCGVVVSDDRELEVSPEPPPPPLNSGMMSMTTTGTSSKTMFWTASEDGQIVLHGTVTIPPPSKPNSTIEYLTCPCMLRCYTTTSSWQESFGWPVYIININD